MTAARVAADFGEHRHDLIAKADRQIAGRMRNINSHLRLQPLIELGNDLGSAVLKWRNKAGCINLYDACGLYGESYFTRQIANATVGRLAAHEQLPRSIRAD